ncbi:uncharacterized protein BDZ99DRAFT_55798 [Mytilinidion resinicola]|uniref:Uncharacterized protein n=1 Tax=Mytilinidion resinicola TaxID=574789 RepID=A0A6A6YI14_9PEZI|nr:uncharacterized protein BDZ99DRAFT_55798 [Mytilinidion resinicola]KAF2808441.1 hypothetical protein BDZ99DRAFT_55798 [Mytilinidion resinicola]
MRALQCPAGSLCAFDCHCLGCSIGIQKLGLDGKNGMHLGLSWFSRLLIDGSFPYSGVSNPQWHPTRATICLALEDSGHGSRLAPLWQGPCQCCSGASISEFNNARSWILARLYSTRQSHAPSLSIRTLSRLRIALVQSRPGRCL